MTHSAFKEIFLSLQKGTATREEMELFMNALQKQEELARYFQQLLVAYFEDQGYYNSTDQILYPDAGIRENRVLDELLAKSWAQIEEKTTINESVKANENDNDPADQISEFSSYNRQGKSQSIKWLVAAAVLFIVALFAGFYLCFSPQNGKKQVSTAMLNVKHAGPIVPGKAAAILSFDNGGQVALDSSEEQKINNGNQLVAYNKDGKIDYHTGSASNEKPQYNILTTQKGNRYQLILPDGTKAWLNAESSIHFPSKFPEHQRIVQITGEVYFEVMHDELRPFTVEVKGQTIRDIGTTFNINAYENESSIKTTLIEGVIEVNHTRLKPGWQAVVQPGGQMIIDKHADLAEITSWKNNIFLFHQTDMRSILRQVARWYDVDVVCKGKFDQTFTGGISRQASLDEVLKILSFSNKIKFEVHDRNIIVQPN